MSKLDELKKQVDVKPTIEPTPTPIVEPIVKEPPAEIKTIYGTPIKKGETHFTEEDKQNTVDKTLLSFKNKHIKLRKREKKMIKNREYDSIKNTQGIVIGLAIVGLVFLIVLRNILPNEAMYAIVIIIGSFMFIPVGMIVGWIMFDVFIRCKMLRRISKRNYGIVNFVGKGKRIVSKIKNFDHGLIWQKEDLWVLTKGKIYQQTKDGNAANEGYSLDPDSVLTLVDTVPVIFVDMDSMEPLSITQQGRTPIYPSEIGSACKAWIDVQRAKLLSSKKTMDILLIIAVICCIGAIVVSVLTMNKVEELTKLVQALQ
jgi:hypothetical protein